MKFNRRYLNAFLSVITLILLSSCAEIKNYSDELFISNSNRVGQENSTTKLPTNFDGINQEVVINDNVPTFTPTDLDLSQGVFQTFSDLDNQNRVGVANALIGKESFPTEERESLYIKPTGWNQKKLENGQWLYNRCHLIGFQLTGENNNIKNLITGTRSFNTPHMLNFEN